MERGWEVTRLKIETTPSVREDSSNCPVEDADVAKYPPTNYFEFHAKMELPLQNKAQHEKKLQAWWLSIKLICLAMHSRNLMIMSIDL